MRVSKKNQGTMEFITGYSSSEDETLTANEAAPATLATVTAGPLAPACHVEQPSILQRMMADARKNPLSSNQPMRKDAFTRAQIPSEEAGHDKDNSGDGKGDSDVTSDCASDEDLGETEPELAEIERKRKLKMKRETKSGKHRGGGLRLSKQPKVRPEQRISEFPGEGLQAVPVEFS